MKLESFLENFLAGKTDDQEVIHAGNTSASNFSIIYPDSVSELQRGACHARLAGNSSAVLVVNYSKISQFDKEGALLFIDFLINRSQYATCFEVKDPELSYRKGLVCRLDSPRNLLLGALQLCRYFSDSSVRETMETFCAVLPYCRNINPILLLYVVESESLRLSKSFELVSGRSGSPRYLSGKNQTHSPFPYQPSLEQLDLMLSEAGSKFDLDSFKTNPTFMTKEIRMNIARTSKVVGIRRSLCMSPLDKGTPFRKRATLPIEEYKCLWPKLSDLLNKKSTGKGVCLDFLVELTKQKGWAT